MGLSSALDRSAVRAAHVLVAETPGHWVTRAAVERCALQRGWRLADSPADADVLAVCGEPGPELAQHVDLVWAQLPGPRARVDVRSPEEATSALEGARTGLLDSSVQRRDARDRPRRLDPGAGQEQDHGDHGGHGAHGAHSDHGDHGDMEMAPEGVALAGGGEDRDGLEMDVLQVPLGPVLAYWPAGLVLRCALQGDVVVSAEASVLDPGTAVHAGSAGHNAPTAWDETAARGVRSAARRCDNLAGLLALAGWPDGAARARRVRDLLLGPADPPGPARELEDLGRRTGRSRLLRWSLRGVRPVPDTVRARHGLPGRVGGDTHDRMLAMVRRALLDLGTDQNDEESDGVVPVTAVPALVTGLDLATARLVVASLDLDAPHAVREDARG